MTRLIERLSAPLRVMAVSCGALLLVACGDPAPGEGIESTSAEAPEPKVVPAAEALQNAVIVHVDLTSMHAAEIAKVLPSGPYCSFAYTETSGPVFAAAVPTDGTAAGVIKVQGALVEVAAPENSLEGLADGAVFETEGVRIAIKPELDADTFEQGSGGYWPATVIFELEQGLRAGYRGWYSCGELET